MGSRKVANPKQDRKFLIQLYPDAENYDFADALIKLQDYFEMWAWVIHDKDTKSDTGELVKRHCHFVGRRAAAVSVTAVSNLCGVPVNYIEFSRSFKATMRYLVHADNPEKYQYDKDTVTANFDYLQFCKFQKDSDYANRILTHIIDNRVVSTTELSQWAIEHGCWSEFRRAYRIWYDVMFEVKGLPADAVPAQFNSDNDNQMELDGVNKHPDAFDPQSRKR